MEQIVIRGIISKGDYQDDWAAVFIGDTDQPFIEKIQNDIDGKQVSLRYFISDTEKSKDELLENLIKQISGDSEAEYNSRYSDLTGYLWTDQNLKIGGHDVLAEISSYEGKFIHLEIDVH